VNTLPSTGQIDSPKVTFGFCDGSTLQHSSLCNGKECEKFDFKNLIDDGVEWSSSRCGLESGQLPVNSRLVTISETCSGYVDSGVCLELPDDNGVGRAYLLSEGYVYKNTLDILALVIGSDEQTIYGVTGQNYYTYVNSMFTDFMTTATGMMSERAGMIAARLDPESQIASERLCRDYYYELETILGLVNGLLVDSPNYYQSEAETGDLMSWLETAKDTQYLLVVQGCEFESFAEFV
jgi:hypothetical protein